MSVRLIIAIVVRASAYSLRQSQVNTSEDCKGDHDPDKRKDIYRQRIHWKEWSYLLQSSPCVHAQLTSPPSEFTHWMSGRMISSNQCMEERNFYRLSPSLHLDRVQLLGAFLQRILIIVKLER